MAENRAVKYNIRSAYYAPITDSGYGTPVAIPGAVSATLSQQGDAAEFYADGILWYSANQNSGYQGDFECVMIPQSFLTDILGETADSNNVIFENVNALQKNFAFGFVIDGNTETRYYWFLNCNASRPAVNANTNTNTKNPETDTISITCVPDENGDVKARYIKQNSATSDAVADGWFTKVIEKATTPNP